MTMTRFSPLLFGLAFGAGWTNAVMIDGGVGFDDKMDTSAQSLLDATAHNNIKDPVAKQTKQFLRHRRQRSLKGNKGAKSAKQNVFSTKSCKSSSPKSGNYNDACSTPATEAVVATTTPAMATTKPETFVDRGVPCDEAIVLYSNDFENPKVEWMESVGGPGFPFTQSYANLDSRPVNELYGTPEFPFTQTFTVETVSLTTSPWSDPEGVGGLYAIGMFAGSQEGEDDDRLGLLLDTNGKTFISVSIDISSSSLINPGGLTWNGQDPMLQVRLIDNPNNDASVSIFDSGTQLDSAQISAAASDDPYTTRWKTGQVSLIATAATTNSVTIMWDVLRGGALYTAFDNLVISASDCPF